MATQNLGNVRALIPSATAPTNTDLLWRNTSVSPQTINLYNSMTSVWEPIAMSSGGQDNTASNLGTGEGVFATKVGVDLRFKSFADGGGATFSSNANEISVVINDTTKIPLAQRGAANGVATLDGSSTLTTSQLPGTVVTRTRVSASTVSPSYAINWNSANEYVTSGLLTINANTTVTHTNTTNAELAVIDLNVTGSERTLMFPTGTRMQTSETRWVSGTMTLSLSVGRYKLTIKRISNTDYTMECSDAYA